MGTDIVAICMGRISSSVLVTFLLVWLLRREGRLLRAGLEWVQARLERRGKGIGFRNVEFLSVASILGFTRSFFGSARIVVSLSLVYAWILVVAWALDASHRVFGVVVAPLIGAVSTVASALLGFVPNLAMIAVILTVARFASRVVVLVSEALAEKRLEFVWLDPELVTPTRRIAKLAIWAIALVLVAPFLPGSESRAFLGVAITAGVVLSLGSTSVSSNLLSGLVLTYARVFRVGDRVRIGQVEGTVTGLGPFMTRLRADDGAEVIIPNAIVQSAPIANLTRRDPPTAA